MKKKGKIDKFFLSIVLLLLALGVIFFLSASLGILARNSELFWNIVTKQFLLGFLGGGVLFFVGFKIPYTFWKKNAFFVFLAALGLMVLVLIPGLSFEHGGARRWISLGSISFQPAEILKIAFIIYFSAWLSWIRKEVSSFKHTTVPFLIILGIMALLLFLQPDTKSFILMTITGVIMLFISGTPLKYFIIIGICGVALFSILALTTPYIQKRIDTFIHPSKDTQGSSYQLKQALIGFGSGGLFGTGFGQSVQKFGYLPEPHGDSIFAVIGEEIGFIGSTFFILLYLAFALRGLRISYHAPDQFSKLLVIGIICILTVQSFMNIASLTGLFPLTGVPLVFISHGGTSLAFSLFMIGLVVQISQYQKIKK